MDAAFAGRRRWGSLRPLMEEKRRGEGAATAGRKKGRGVPQLRREERERELSAQGGATTAASLPPAVLAIAAVLHIFRLYLERMWNHADCILKKANRIKSPDDVEGIELLRWEDQQKIRKYAEGGGSQKTSAPVITEFGIELSQTSRVTCRHCKQKIMKGEVRISTKPEGQGSKGLAWHHAKCYMESSPVTQVEKLSGWENLPASDQEVVCALIKKAPPTRKSGTKIEIQEDEEPSQQLTSKGGPKRKRAVSSDQKQKVAKTEDDASAKITSVKIANNLGDELPRVSDSHLEAQTKELWALKDDLLKYVTTSELREMLEANDQGSTGSEFDLRDCCADGMLFGALGKCPLCSGSLRYSGGVYKYQGFLSAWSKCSYATTEPARVKGNWNIQEGTHNKFLYKWFKFQNTTKPVRVLPPSSSRKASGSEVVKGHFQSSNGEKLGDLRVAINGMPKKSLEEWKSKIEKAGGQVYAKIKEDTNCFVVSGVLDSQIAETRKARRMKLPILREDYLTDCIKRQQKLPFDMYKIEATGDASCMVTVKVKGRSAVHEWSGLQ